MESIKDDNKIKYLNFLMEMCIKEFEIAQENLISWNKRVLGLYNYIHESNKNEGRSMTNDDVVLTDLLFISTLLRTFNINTLTHDKLDQKNFIPLSESIISNASHQRRNKNPFIDEDELSVDSMTTFEQASLNDITYTDCNSEGELYEKENNLFTTNELKDLLEESFNSSHDKLDQKNFIPQSESIISNASHQRRNKNPFIDEDELSVDSMTTFEQASLNDITYTDCNSEGELYEKENNLLTTNELKDLFEEPFNSSNVMEAVMGFDPKDEEKLCKFFDPKTNSCFKGNNCKKEHSLKITEGWTKDKDIIKLNSVAEITYPAIGQKIKLIPTFIQTVEKFYAHLCNNQHGPVSTLRTMIIKMNAPEYISKYKLLSRLPAEHELVFALFNDDNWYRAKIITLIDENTVKVMLLDFGNINIINVSRIREWCTIFDYLPFQAISCRLANIKKVKNYHVEAIDQLKKKILNKAINATVVDNADELSVLLTDDEGIDVGQLLYISKLGILKKVNSFKTKCIPA